MTEWEEAICPECVEETIIVETAPRKPPRMKCQNCEWVSYPPNNND